MAKINDTDINEVDLEELAEQQRTHQVIERSKMPFDLKDMVEKVVKFCEAVSGTTFYPYQREYSAGIVESLLLNDGEEITALFSRQSGKTETNACTAAGCMIILPILAKLFPTYEPLQSYKDGLWVGIFAPSGDQAGTTYSRLRARIRSKNSEMILQDDDIDLELSTKSGRIALNNGSFCVPMSASRNAHIESKTYHLLMIEEAQDVDNRVVRKSIHPMGAATNATVIKVGTANARRSDFSDAVKRNRRRNTPKRRFHFQNDYKVVQKHNPRYKKYVQKEMERLGKDSDEFRMAYACEFIFERGMFMTEDRWDQLIENSPKNLQLTHACKDRTCVAGIDWAKRQDSTVVTVMAVDWDKPVEQNEDLGLSYYKKTILDWLELTGDDYESQFYQIVEFLDRYDIRVICSDATGAGDPMVDRLRLYYEDRAEVIGIVFNSQSKHQLYTFLNQEILGTRIEVPHGSRVERYRKWQNFKSQLMDLEKTWRGKLMICHHPAEKGAHDDYPDSLALAVWASQQEQEPEVEEYDSPFFASNKTRRRESNALIVSSR